MASLAENADPNLSAVVADAAGKPPRSKKLRVSISPKKPTVLSPGSTRARRRRSSSHFGNKGKKLTVDDDTDDEMSVNDDDSDIEFTLEGATNIDTGDKNTISSTPTSSNTNSNNKGKKKKTKKPQQQQRRRRRSSARFLRLSSGGTNDGDNSGGSPGSNNNNNDDDDNEYTSSEHLGEIYRQAIRMNAENKINAGNSWGLKLIENMDKFIVDNNNTTTGEEGDVSPRDNARDELKAARKMKSKDDKGRVNFTKASCTLDASVKIYSYRVDDVHLSSYRVLANLNRTDNTSNNKGNDGDDDEGGIGGGGGESGGGEKVVKRRTGPRGPTETLESNMGMYLFCWCCFERSLTYMPVSHFLTSSHHTLEFCLIHKHLLPYIPANINMSKLDSAYDIDPLFHKMSKSFDEGGAKGLLLGNLGVSQHGCHIVFDSKNEDEEDDGVKKLDKINEEEDEENEDINDKGGEDGDNEFNIDPEEAKVWNEGEIDITNLASKLESMLASYGHRTSDSVPFVPQLESLRRDYAILEEEGFGVDEKDAAKEGRKRLKLYDAP